MDLETVFVTDANLNCIAWHSAEDIEEADDTVGWTDDLFEWLSRGWSIYDSKVIPGGLLRGSRLLFVLRKYDVAAPGEPDPKP